jgi:DNA polymerase III subunit delta
MPILLYWGDDEFALNQAAIELQKNTVDAAWASFNYEKIAGDQPAGTIQALNQAMTPPFGSGQRLIWLVNTHVVSQCSESILAELERTLPDIPATTTLLLSSVNKPDGRLKASKFIQKQATVREFALLPPWKTAEISQQVKQLAQKLGVNLTKEAIDLLAALIGNNTRQLHTELTKLSLFALDQPAPLTASAVSGLVMATTQNSLQLANALRQGDLGSSLSLIQSLIQRNEPALKIVATLVGQFRTWLWVKILTEDRIPDEQIAKEADLGNPKRLYFLRQDLQQVTVAQLQQVLPELLQLEFALKQGQEPEMTLQTRAIAICQIMTTSAVPIATEKSTTSASS